MHAGLGARAWVRGLKYEGRVRQSCLRAARQLGTFANVAWSQGAFQHAAYLVKGTAPEVESRGLDICHVTLAKVLDLDLTLSLSLSLPIYETRIMKQACLNCVRMKWCNRGKVLGKLETAPCPNRVHTQPSSDSVYSDLEYLTC